MKKIISLILCIALCISVSIPAFAADTVTYPPETTPTTTYEISMLNEYGQYTTYNINPDEGATLPVYQFAESKSNDSSYAVVQTATLSIGKSSYDYVYWKFTPTLSTLLLTLGFTGSFSVTDFNGLSHGQYNYLLQMSSYVPGPSRGGLTLSGTYYVTGFTPASIFQHVRF